MVTGLSGSCIDLMIFYEGGCPFHLLNVFRTTVYLRQKSEISKTDIRYG